ncbi:hypothetical protein GCM10010533_15530 [Mycolicibacterium pallens]
MMREANTAPTERSVAWAASLRAAMSLFGAAGTGSRTGDAASTNGRVWIGGGADGGSLGKCIAAVASTFIAVTVITLVAACVIAPTLPWDSSSSTPSVHERDGRYGSQHFSDLHHI